MWCGSDQGGIDAQGVGNGFEEQLKVAFVDDVPSRVRGEVVLVRVGRRDDGRSGVGGQAPPLADDVKTPAGDGVRFLAKHGIRLFLRMALPAQQGKQQNGQEGRLRPPSSGGGRPGSHGDNYPIGEVSSGERTVYLNGNLNKL